MKIDRIATDENRLLKDSFRRRINNNAAIAQAVSANSFFVVPLYESMAPDLGPILQEPCFSKAMKNWDRFTTNKVPSLNQIVKSAAFREFCRALQKKRIGCRILWQSICIAYG